MPAGPVDGDSKKPAHAPVFFLLKRCCQAGAGGAV